MLGQFQPLTSVEEYERAGPPSQSYGATSEIFRLAPGPVSTLPLFPDVPAEYADWGLLQSNFPTFTFPGSPAPTSEAADPGRPAEAGALPTQRAGWSLVPLAILGTLAFLFFYRGVIEPRRGHA